MFALSIFYLLNKYNFLEKEFFFIIIITFSIVIFDSFIQLIFKKNIFGYISIDYEGGVTYLTSFFKDEKKLGSYLVRFLPLLLSLVVINNFKNSNKIEITILLISGIIIFYSSERVAFLLLLVVYFFYFLISNKKIYFIVFGILTIICLFTFNQNLAYKYTSFTLQQTGLIFLSNSKKNIKDKEEAKRMFKDNKLRYYSLEHENLSYTALIVAKENYLLGRGIKSFYSQCERLKKEKNNYNTKRNNQLLCSTHPHNTYLQLLSEIGVFGAVMIIYIFFKSFVSNLKLLFQNKINNTHKAWYFLNICIIINLMPLIPSGSFFNNWLSLMIFFPLGFWLYFKQRLS